MTRPRLVLITNIPTPYRVYLYHQIHNACESRDIAFEVWFMDKSEPGRYWDINPDEWAFTGEILSGFHFTIQRIPVHINPQAWLKLIRKPPTWLFTSGWQLPTNIGAYWLPLRHTYNLMWAEANMNASRQKEGPIARYRKLALEKCDAIVIPGQIARETILDHWQVNPQSLLYLPNLVDETHFRETVTRLRLNKRDLCEQYGLSDAKKVLFWSARLNDQAKGITRFLDIVDNLPLTIMLAGDGQDRPKIETWAKEHPDFDLRILGHVPQNEVLQYMAMSDVAILPSISDPNPLSMIEAIWSGLPVLASTHNGNWPETVAPNENGWLVNPLDEASVRKAVAEIVGSDREHLVQMGHASQELAKKNFDSEQKVMQFIDSLLEQFPPH